MAHLWKRQRRTSGMISEINVTPFVDVMLVLLIIFMITAPLARFGFDVSLPKVEAGPVTREETWVISVDRHKKVFLNDKEIKPHELENRLTDLIHKNPQTDVFLHADESLPYGFVMQVMGIARHAGVRNLGMVTGPPAPENQNK